MLKKGGNAADAVGFAFTFKHITSCLGVCHYANFAPISSLRQSSVWELPVRLSSDKYSIG